MIEELRANIDKYVKDTCVYYRSTHEDMLPNQFEKYLRSACVHFATEATKEVENKLANADYQLEGRDNEIKELTEQNTSLLTSVENLNKSVQELEAQIKKMKCWANCKNYSNCLIEQADKGEGFDSKKCRNCNKWEIKRR